MIFSRDFAHDSIIFLNKVVISFFTTDILEVMIMLDLNEENFEKEVANSDIPVIVDFWAEWCGPCRMMAPVFEELSREYEGEMKFTKLNTQYEPGLAMRFGVRGIPTLMIFNEGRPVDTIVGFGPKEILKSKIDEILKKI